MLARFMLAWIAKPSIGSSTGVEELAQVLPTGISPRLSNTIAYPEEQNMIPSCRMETLESRQLLSVAAPVMAEAQPLDQPVVTLMATQPKLVANSDFLGSPTLGGISGKLALKIKTVSGTAVTATLYSTDYGGFTVAVTGTISSAGAISLAGKSSTCQVTAFKGSLNSTSKSISGSCAIIQMGVALKGTITETRTATAPVLKTLTYPSLLGKYRGTLSGGGNPIFSITKQTGGLFWGKTNDGNIITGFQSAPGVFHFHWVSSDSYTNVTGTRHSDGSLSGSAIKYGNDGSKKTQTFVVNKV
jgi:hypothetical protein